LAHQFSEQQNSDSWKHYVLLKTFSTTALVPGQSPWSPLPFNGLSGSCGRLTTCTAVRARRK
jgi:hypothetical protein